MEEENGKMNIEDGPWGGNGGASWDDGCYHGVRGIKLAYDRCINSICVIYDRSGKAVMGDKHGGVGGRKTAEIKLNFPEEYLISVSGHYFPQVCGGTSVIKSLLFKSNKRIFGPYGVEEGTPFSFPMDGGKICGFKGRSGWYLDAIGFHLRRVQSTKMKKKLLLWLQRSIDRKNNKENTMTSGAFGKRLAPGIVEIPTPVIEKLETQDSCTLWVVGGFSWVKCG